MLDQDVLHTGFADRVTQINNLVPDLLVAPAWILLLERDDEFYCFLWNLRSTSRCAILRSIVSFGNQFAVPAHNSIWRRQFCTLLQHLSTEPFGLGRHSHPLSVGQRNTFVPSFLMLDENSHLFSQVIDRLVELFVDALGQTCDH